MDLHGFMYTPLCRKNGGYLTALCLLIHLHTRGDSACIAPFHAVVDVGVFGGDFGAALAESFLDDAQILGLLVEVRAAAMAEEVAGVARLFESRCGERAVDDVADRLTQGLAKDRDDWRKWRQSDSKSKSVINGVRR